MITPSNILRFKYSARNDFIEGTAISLVALAMLAVVWVLDDRHRPDLSPLFILIGLLGFLAYFLALVAWMQIQRVEIDTQNHTVRFANCHTYHLWQSFSLDDALSIRAVAGLGTRNGISIGMKSVSGRERDSVYLDNLDKMPKKDPIDTDLFLALVKQIRLVHPTMKIGGMPTNYQGNVPNEICVFDRKW